MELDFKTLLFFIILNNVFIIVLLSYFLIQKNIQRWFFLVYLLGKTFQTISLVGIMLRGIIPMFLSVQISNFFLIFSFGINAFAILSYDGKFRKNLFYFYLVLISIFYLSFIVYVNNYSIRMLIQITASVFSFGVAGVILFRRRKKYNFLYLIGITFFVFSVFQIIRALFVLKIGADYDFFNEIFVDKLFFIVTSLALSVTSIGFLLLLLEIKTETISEKNLIIKERNKQLLETNQTIVSLQEFKEQMMHMMIHDLKTPLNTIINVHSIRNDIKKNRLIQQSGYTMLNLVQNVLDVYKYKNADIELSKRKVELWQILNRAIEEIDFSAKQSLLDIKINIDFEFVVNVDPEIIRRVLVNLLTNAVKYSPVNGIIEIDAKINKENLLRVSVYNQGDGIPKEKQEKIFEKFGQAEQKNRQDSTGLGLTFCKIAIEAHKGKIGVISESKLGVEFWFTLPDSYQGDMQDHIANQSSIKVSLTNEEIEYLKPFIDEIKKYQSFQITSINNVLAKIERKDINIVKWIEDLTETLYSGDKSKHDSLIKF